MAEAGSVYAEAELNIDKFQEAAAQLEGEGSKIAGAMDECAAGLDKAQTSLDALGESAASVSFDQSTSSAEALQAALDEARAKSEGLATAYEQAVSQFGEGSAQAAQAAQAFDTNMDKIEGLEQQLAGLGSQLAEVNGAMATESALPASMEQAAASIESTSAAVETYKSEVASVESTTASLSGSAAEVQNAGTQIAAAMEQASSGMTQVESTTASLSGSAVEVQNAGTQIAAAMEQASSGMTQIEGSSSALALSLEAARASMAAAQLTFEQSDASLSAMKTAFEEACAKTEELGKAYEKTVARFGKGSLPEFEAAKEFDEALATQEALDAQMQKQQITVRKNEAAFKKAAAAVANYEGKLAATEGAVAGLDSQMEGLNSKLQSDAMVGYGEAADVAVEGSQALSGALGGMLTRTASSAARSLGTLTAKTLGFDTSTATGIMAARGLSTGLRQIVQSAGAATLVHAALGAAVAYGAYKLYDYASGAAAARESLEKLVEVAKQWEETNVTTSFEKSEGLKGFGLSAEDFGVPKGDAKDWVSTVIDVWTDGKKETDQIVSEMVKGFTSGSDELRGQLSSIQTTAQTVGAGDSGILGDIDTDMARLDEIDGAVEKLLKKRQNGFLTEDEKGQLQSLYDERESIAIKYHLEEDGTSGYDEIVQGAEAALRRGESGADVWADAYSAASQGQAAYIDSLNAEYDARYKVIDLMDEGAEKQAALAELDSWYNEQNVAGIQAYAEALASVAQQTGVFEENGQYAETTTQLATAVDAMNKAAADPSPENMQAFTDALAGLDETQVVEMAASLTAMQAAGVEMSDGMTTALESIEALKGAASSDAFKGVEDLFTSLNSMFGENLDSEVHELNLSLNTDNLNTVYDGWAAGEHTPINASIDTGTITTELTSLSIDGLTGKITAVTGDGQTFTIQDISINPETGHIEAITADGQTLTIQDLTINPETGHITAMTADGKVLTIDALTTNPETGHVNAITADGQTLDIVDLTINPLTGHVEAITADGQTLTIDDLTLDALTGTVTTVTISPDVEVPPVEVEANVTKVNFEQGKYTNSGNAQLDYTKGAAGANANDSTGKWYDFLHLTQSDVQVLNDYAEAIRNYNAAQESGDTAGMAEASSQIDTFGNSLYQFLDTGEGFADMASMVANGLQLMSQGELDPEQAQALLTTITDLQTVAGSLDSNWATPITEGLAEAFSSDNLSIGWEGVDFSNLGTTLETAMSTVDFSSAGQSAGEGVGSGLAGTDVSGDAQTFVTGVREAVGAAEGEGSPAALFMPAGESAGQGFGKGLSATDVSADAQTFINNVLTALQTAAAVGFDLVGMTIAQGLATGFASGLLTGSATVTTNATGLVTGVTSAIDMAGANTTNSGLLVSQNFASGISSGSGTAETNAKGLVDGANSALDSAGSNASAPGSELAQGFAGGIASGAGTAASNASSMANSAVSAARGGMSGAASIGRSFASGLASGISSGRSAVISAATSIAQAAAQAARSALAIHSPSKVTERFGRYFDLGFISGVDKLAPDIEKSVRDAVYIEPPAGALYGTARLATPSVKVQGQPIDYDRLADAMNQRQMVLTMNNRRLAEVQQRETARAQATRNRNLALGRGKR